MASWSYGHDDSRRMPTRRLRRRLAGRRWPAIEVAPRRARLGHLPGACSRPRECRDVAALYPDDRRFRSHVVMARHGFGRGEYKYFALPAARRSSRGCATALYPRLAPVANRWNEALGIDVRVPADARASSSRGATTPASAGRRRCCCSTARATSTRSTRTSTASTCSRCRWRSCCRGRARTSRAGSSC